MSRLTAKLINRRISEKTCLVAWASPRGGVSAPDGVLLSGGDPSVARRASPAPVPGKATRLPLGEVRRPRVLDVGGSISIVVRNDVCSSSGFVLVMVTKKSSRSFCSARGVPFKSMICEDARVSRGSLVQCNRLRVSAYLLEVGERRVTNQKRVIKDKTFSWVLNTV